MESKRLNIQDSAYNIIFLRVKILTALIKITGWIYGLEATLPITRLSDAQPSPVDTSLRIKLI